MYFTEAEKIFGKISVRVITRYLAGGVIFHPPFYFQTICSDMEDSVENCDLVGYNKKKYADSHKIWEECIGETYEGKRNVL